MGERLELRPQPVMEFASVSKGFVRHGEGSQLIRGHLAGLFRRHRQTGDFLALNNVSFRLHRGEALAIVGSNGAGKSTLLSIAAGVCEPDAGRVSISGRVAALLELGSGFHPDLTGVENVFLNASLLGLTRNRTNECYDSIVEFSGIGSFMREPIRTYSSGMVMRLAFAVAVHLDPDILIIDEVLAVGDKEFQTKCHDKIADLRAEGKSLLFVSHAGRSTKVFCERALWLDHGRVVMDSDIDSVVDRYESAVSSVQAVTTSVAVG
jgi:ABC-type polysaccharide/polyol phosphate transport system ATPase subunit